ncbi:MAG TPA: M48 family metalloprotease [Candidatus Binatia bacterium]|jgi:Zn-dependent protease with chaperone function
MMRLKRGAVMRAGIGFLIATLSGCSASTHWSNLPEQRSGVVAYLLIDDNDRIRPAVGLVHVLAEAVPLPVDKLYVFTSRQGNTALKVQAFQSQNAGAFRCGKGDPPPSGCVYVGDEVLAALSLDALAGVLAHELGHLERGHKPVDSDLQKARGMTRTGNQLCGQMVPGAIGALAGVIGCALALGGLASAATISSYSRDLEREADESALNRLKAAGVQCPSLVMQKAFSEVSNLPGVGQGGGLFSTHPSLRERWQNANAAC